MAAKSRRRRLKNVEPSYTQKQEKVRQFYKIPPGKLTPTKKAWLTRKFNELRKFSALRFHKLDKKKREHLKARGYRTTDKGVFLPQRGDEKIEVRNKHIKHSSKSRAGSREEFEFPLDNPRAFFDNPRQVINQIIADNPRIFNPRKGVRRRWRLVFNLGDQELLRGLDELEEYIKQVSEQPLRGKNGVIRKSADDRVKEISNNMVALRVVFTKGTRTRKKK